MVNMHRLQTSLLHTEQEAGWAPGPVWIVLEKRKTYAPTGMVQTVANRYTNCTIPVTWTRMNMEVKQATKSVYEMAVLQNH
jgi:hypothetical protein